jgi:hypothetical protein
MMTFLIRAVDAGGSANIVDRVAKTSGSLRIRYSGRVATFMIDELRVGSESCFVAAGAIAAETLEVDWDGPVLRDTEILCRIRNVSATPAAFVAGITRR